MDSTTSNKENEEPSSNTKRTVKAVIFDLDGVIVDTARFHFKAWQRLAESLGIPFGREDNEQLKGVSRAESLERILAMGDKQLEAEEKKRLMDRKNDWYRESVGRMDADDILDGVMAFLDRLKEMEIPMAIGSSSKNTPLILDRIGLADFFDAVVDGNSISRGKPDPEVFLKGARALNVAPAHCLVFEDAAAGIEAARNAGMFCVGVGEESVLGAADLVIESMEEITPESLFETLEIMNHKA